MPGADRLTGLSPSGPGQILTCREGKPQQVVVETRFQEISNLPAVASASEPVKRHRPTG